MSRQMETHCKDCNNLLTVSNTVWANSRSKFARCRDCYNKHQIKRRTERESINPELAFVRKSKTRNRDLRRLYNITQDDYDAQLILQLNGCAICKLPFNSTKDCHIDHDHTTGNFRGLLCDNCNHLLGMAQDDEEILIACIEYLKHHDEKVAV